MFEGDIMTNIPLFKLKEEPRKTVDVNHLDPNDLDSMYQRGLEKAKAHNGGEAGLLVNLKIIYEKHKDNIKKDLHEQQELKKPYLVKYQDYIKSNDIYQKKIDKLKEEDIPKVKVKCDEIKQEIIDIKKNPDDHLQGDAGKASFIIGIIILSFLTLYLFIFYSSATYSSFFKEFKLTELGVANSIFDGQALNKAYADGFTELLLLLTIPFVFLGLGYLIHKFQEQKSNKKYFKVAMLIAVTFIFDTILAYEISEKIYNVKAENSFIQMAPYSLSMAFQSMGFWMIIFAGFIVYLIWGFVFDFVMESHSKMDRVNTLVVAKKEELINKEKQIAEFEEEINKLNYMVGKNLAEAEKLKTIIDNSNIIKPKDLENAIHRFMDGWLEWLTSDRRNDDEKNRAHFLVGEFLDSNIRQMDVILNGANNGN